MPNLLQLLRTQDLGYVRIATELWGLEVLPNDLEAGVEAAASAMLDEQLAAEVVEALDAEARSALMALTNASGRMPWTAFTRRFGDVRDMGAGRRDREHPHLHPASAAEALYYRALLGRAFFETEGGPQEFAYVPSDLLSRLPRPEAGSQPGSPAGRAATPSEYAFVAPASDRILDEATTFLAALRTGRTAEPDPVLTGLLECAGVLHGGIPDIGRVRALLAAPRTDALKMLADAWRDCDSFNELRLIPGLICEGPWSNQPGAARKFLLVQLQALPANAWWNLSSFVESIKQERPDFQRPAGDYDSWFIKRLEDGRYLRGFESWNQVDGALIRFTITRVMHRLGLVDLGSSAAAGEPLAFRLAQRLSGARAEVGRLKIGSQGRITAGRDVPRAIRYQLARFCEWDEPRADEDRYHITPSSLTRARGQRLTVEHLLTMLARHADGGVPPALARALRRWDENGTEAQAEAQVVLRVRTPEMLKRLRASKAARYLGESLGPTSVIVKSGAIRKVEEAMTELGVLLEDKTGGPA
jgi:hypothetical protein